MTDRAAIDGGHRRSPAVAERVARPLSSSVSFAWRSAARFLTPLRVRAVRDGLSVLGLLALAWALVFAPADDVRAYWAVNAADPYGGTVGSVGAFLYSPVVALVALPIHLLPFEVVRVLLAVVDLACLVYLARGWALALVALPPVLGDIAAGNVHILLAVAIALGFRYPATWSFVLLTKVTPGIGVLWFAVRREWRELAVALGVTAALSAVSFLLVPSWWADWIRVVASSGGVHVTAAVLTGAPLALRLVAAAAIVAWGAWTGRQWTVMLAAMLALPEVWVMGTCLLLGALPGIRRRVAGSRATGGGVATG